MLESIYRPYRSGSIPALIHARSAGHYIVPAEWEDIRMKKDFLELFWCVSGTGEFRCMNSAFLLNPGDVCFYFPGDCHDITAKSPWEYYWLTVDGPDPELLIRLFRLERAPRYAGKCPAELFTRLSGELRDSSSRGEFRAGATVYEILSLAMAGGEPEESGKLKQFRELVEDRFSDPDLEVESIAERMGIHRSTLTRLVARCCGISPVEYLISFRVQEALRLLNDTEYTVKEIAACTGFRDQNYFTKVITRRLGKPPSALRRI